MQGLDLITIVLLIMYRLSGSACDEPFGSELRAELLSRVGFKVRVEPPQLAPISGFSIDIIVISIKLFD